MKKPRYSNYRGHPIDGLHHDMKDWAFAQSKPDLISEIIFEDGSVVIDRYPPAQREVLYWAGHENNGHYSVNVDVGNRWLYCGDSLGVTQIRELETELAKKAGAVKSIRVFKEKVNDLSKLEKGRNYVFRFRSGRQVVDQLDPNWEGRIDAYRLLKTHYLFGKCGQHAPEQGQTPRDIIQITKVEML